MNHPVNATHPTLDKTLAKLDECRAAHQLTVDAEDNGVEPPEGAMDHETYDDERFDLLADLETLLTPDPDAPADLDFYAWRVPVDENLVLAAVSGNPIARYLIPHSDPQYYEFQIDAIFPSIDEAEAYRDDMDLTDEAIAQGWSLIHYRGELVGP